MYRILIADDEAIIREGIKCLFDWNELGFEIVGEAANGDQALEKLMTLKPDVALFDIRMPGMTGLEVLKVAREQGFEGHIIILSGYSDFKYAQDAIHYGVKSYLTKPIDEDELQEALEEIKGILDLEKSKIDMDQKYRGKMKANILQDLLLGETVFPEEQKRSFHLDNAPYQVVIYEKYSHNAMDVAYNFADLIRVTNTDNNSFDNITLQFNEVLLLKGMFAIQKFNDFLDRYEREKRPQKGSPLDSLFITYGEVVNTLDGVQDSYQEALALMERRFFCDQEQHTIGYQSLPAFQNNVQMICPELLQEYSASLTSYLQAYNRNMVAETLKKLQDQLYSASDSIDSIKLFLADLFLQIKEQMNHTYTETEIPFPSNAEIIRFINEKYYLYEIILFFTNQFEICMNSIGHSTRDSVLDDIINYIDHNYAGNLTLENIAPLFGYNSSYLGKIFTKKMGETFNSYLDHVRIEHSKELLQNEDIKVYSVAERVGYRNVDYFHIKFKKYVGMSPAEFRKHHK